MVNYTQAGLLDGEGMQALRKPVMLPVVYTAKNMQVLYLAV